MTDDFIKGYEWAEKVLKRSIKVWNRQKLSHFPHRTTPMPLNIQERSVRSHFNGFTDGNPSEEFKQGAEVFLKFLTL